MKGIKVVPVSFLQDQEHYNVLNKAVCRIYKQIKTSHEQRSEPEDSRRDVDKHSSRELIDLLTITMAKLYNKDTMDCLYIPHWEEMTDWDGRTLRNYLQRKKDDSAPASYCRKYDLLGYISLCMQYLDHEYHTYVCNWCDQQE